MAEENTKRKACRPKVEIDLKKIEEYASQLLSNDQIAINLGIGRQTFYNKKNENPEIEEALKRGREKGIAKVTNKLVDSALKGNTTAQIFILKTHGGQEWKEKQEVNLSSDQPISIKLVNDLKE
jgi:hypothetical protein